MTDRNVVELGAVAPRGCDQYGFVATPTADKVIAVCDFARRRPDLGIGLIVGDVGVGKTMAIDAYARGNAGVRVATMTPASTTVKYAYQVIADALDVRVERQIRYQEDCLFLALDRPGPSRTMLIIDEAQHLSDVALDAIRGLWDAAGFPMVWCGNATLRSRFNRTQDAGFAQVLSRVSIRQDLKATKADLSAWCDGVGVVDPQVRERIERYTAGSRWALRAANRLFELAREQRKDGAVTPAAVDAAARLAGLA